MPVLFPFLKCRFDGAGMIIIYFHINLQYPCIDYMGKSSGFQRNIVQSRRLFVFLRNILNKEN